MNASKVCNWMRMAGVALLFVSQAEAQDPAPALVAGSLRKVSDSTGTTFYATWIPNNPVGGVRPEFIYTVAGQTVEQRVFAKPAPIKGTRPIKVSARVVGLKRTTQFEWRAFAGGGANDQDSTTVPDKGPNSGNPLPGLQSAALSVPGTYLGIVNNENGVPVGFCKSTLSAGGVLTGAFDLLLTKYRFSGVMGDDASLVITPIPTKKPSPTVDATFTSDAVTNRIAVSLVVPAPFATGPWTATLVPTNPAHTAKNPSPLAGRYTVLLPIDPAHRADPAFPQGEGFATMVVAATGSTKLIGKVADGTTLTTGSLMDEAGGLSLFAPLYTGVPGFLTGRLVFAYVPGVGDAAGKLRWAKPGPLNLPRVYDAGFATDVNAVASRFFPLANSATAQVFLLSDNLGTVLEKTVTVPAAGGAASVVPADFDQLKLSLAKATGLVTGTVVPSNTLKGPKVPVFGILMLEQQRVGGMFLVGGKSNLLTTLDPTIDPNATVHTATGLPLPIPDDDPIGVSSNLSVNQAGNITECRVSLAITHFFIGDLTVTLTSPTGTTIVLHDEAGGSADNLFFRDIKLPDLVGEAATGTWELHVVDSAIEDDGAIESWSLRLSTQ